jgi:hypothetical protein
MLISMKASWPICLEELWITCESLLEQIGRLQQIGSPSRTGERRQKKIFGVRVRLNAVTSVVGARSMALFSLGERFAWS